MRKTDIPVVIINGNNNNVNVEVTKTFPKISVVIMIAIMVIVIAAVLAVLFCCPQYPLEGNRCFERKNLKKFLTAAELLPRRPLLGIR